MEYTKISDHEWKYNQPPLVEEGWLPVGSGHQIHYETYGNPHGEPVMFVHGGPGSHCKPEHARFFDPKRYRIILFDQRGSGKSKPTIEEDLKAGLQDNNTEALVSDMEALRRHLHVGEKMHIFGGSWGSTLAMAYAQSHPEHVENLILRGIFLCQKDDLDFFYQGNATTYAENPNDTSLPGAYRAYISDGPYTIDKKYRDPRMAAAYAEAWKNYVELIPEAERGDMIAAYNRRLNSPDENIRAKAAVAWAVWEGVTSYLCQDTSREALADYYDKPKFNIPFATIENTFFTNILNGVDKLLKRLTSDEGIATLAKIPIYIVHGNQDQVCALFNAHRLVKMLEDKGGKVHYTETESGHSMTDRATNVKLTDVMDNLPVMSRWRDAAVGDIGKSGAGPVFGR